MGTISYSDKKDEKNWNEGAFLELVTNLSEISQLKGFQALRVAPLFDGDKENLSIPPIEAFVQHNYKQFSIED